MVQGNKVGSLAAKRLPRYVRDRQRATAARGSEAGGGRTADRSREGNSSTRSFFGAEGREERGPMTRGGSEGCVVNGRLELKRGKGGMRLATV